MEVKAAMASAAEFTYSNAALQYEARGMQVDRVSIHPRSSCGTAPESLCCKNARIGYPERWWRLFFP